MISSTTNKQVKFVNALVKKAKTRREEDLFVAEGLRMCSEIPKDRIHTLYLSESFSKTKEGKALREGVKHIELVTDEVFKNLSDTQTPQGILALVKQYHYTLEEVAGGSRKLLVFGDRFPLLYFCREYGLDYRAAFHGCSGDTEPSLATLKYLIDKVNQEDIPVVYTIELSSRKVANAIAETTGARVLTFHSCQTLTRQEFDGGETYLSLMWKNVDVLKEGLA